MAAAAAAATIGLFKWLGRGSNWPLRLVKWLGRGHSSCAPRLAKWLCSGSALAWQISIANGA